MSGSSSSARPSSTFWIIDTTSVSDTFTTTATFTLWVPLNTPSTTSAPSSRTLSVEPSTTPSPHSNTAVIAGSVVGSVLGAFLVLICFLIYYKRRIRRPVVQPRIKPPDTPSGSDLALLDLAAEPAPHPENIEPWVVPAIVRRPNKARDEALRNQAWAKGSGAPRAESSMPPAEIPSAGGLGSPVRVENSPGSRAQRTQSNPQLQAVETQGSSGTLSSTNDGRDAPRLTAPGPSQPRLHIHHPEALAAGTKSSAVPRRRAPREPSPPRLEEDAGVSLMRAEDALPPSYGELVHDRVPPVPT